MNPDSALLSLIAELYAQIQSLRARIAELKAEKEKD